MMKNPNPKDDTSVGLTNNHNKSQDEVEVEYMNQGELEAELPPTHNISTLPSYNSTESEVINAPGPVVTASVAPPVTACNTSVSSLVTPSNPTCPTNTLTSSSTSKTSKKAIPGKSVKTKNSTNRWRGSISKTMDKIATCFEGAGNKSVDLGGQLSMMLMMQQ